MRILAIMPDVAGIDAILNELIEHLRGEGINADFEHRTNYGRAKESLEGTNVVLLHQNCTTVPLEAEDFDEVEEKSKTALVIPLINGAAGNELSRNLFSLGLYNGLFLQDSDPINIAKLIISQRDRNGAKEYYGVDTSEKDELVNKILSDTQVKRIIEFLRASSDKESSFADSVKNLKTTQVLYLLQQLPEELKEELKVSEVYISYERMLTLGEGDGTKPVIIEQLVAQETKVEKTEIIQSVRKKRGMVTVFGNSEFCAEMAYVAAKNSHDDVLVIDLETTVPDIHQILGIKQTVNDGITIGNLFTQSAFLQAYELASSKKLNYDILRTIAVKTKQNNLHVLTGNDVPSKAESFNYKPLRRILDIANDIYGSIFINIPADLYHGFSLYMILNPKSTLIVPFNGGSRDLWRKRQQIELIKKSQGVDMKHVKYLAFEYQSNYHLAEGDIKQMTEGLFLGKVSYDSGRIKARNDFTSLYPKSLPRKIEDEYRQVLSKLGFETRVKLSERMGRLFGRGKR